MYSDFADLKIEIFRDFRVFVLSPIHKNENSEITEIMCHIFVFQEILNPSRFVNFIDPKIQLNFIDPKIKIFHDFWVFVFSPIPKHENSEITEILEKRHNIEIRE